ncbi:MAG: sodium:solute symporter family transporter [Planctomycetota bacterium]
MKPFLTLFAVCVAFSSIHGGANSCHAALNWTELPPLPDPIGVAGPYAGVHRGALIVAGGANFPQAPPWEGGGKVWYDSIYVLEKPDGAWKLAGRLPRPLAYGASVSTPQGVVCVGGSDATQHYADALLLQWDGSEVSVSPLAPLPKPCANLCGAMLGSTIYVAGGTESPTATTALRTFWALDLGQSPPAWKELSPWPGPGRMLSVAAVQDKSLFLASGAELSADGQGNPVRQYLRDAYRYQPERGWRRVADMPRAAVAAPSPAPALGQSTFLILGGDDGTLVTFQPLEQHPGFPKSILAYHTITDTWRPLGETPVSHVTTAAVPWHDSFIIPSGEVRPGVRSPTVWALRTSSEKAAFGWLNYGVMFAYLAGMVWIGFACSKRNKSTNDFFRGGQRIPWWAAGLSIFATMLSSLTFMAIPAASYTDGWNLFLANSYILITPLVVFIYLPFYRALDVTSAYEYLERRFNLETRLAGSALFMIYQCGRIAVVLYLPALALATVSDFNIETCILVMGVLCIAYTVVGGIEAVIWTDVIQAVILVGSALFSLAFILLRVDGGLTEAMYIAANGEHFFETVNWNWDLTVASGWVILIGSLFHNLFPYTASQDVVQRYVTTRDERTAARGIWLNAIVSVPAQAVFFAIGTALFVFYSQHPARLDPTLQNDAIFPFFIMSELPAGVAGLVVAGIFAAAQSTLSSSMNSIATAYVTDFHQRLRPGLSDRGYLYLARVVTVIVGLAGTGAALVLASIDIRTIYSTFLEVLGLLGGTLSGLFVLGIFSRRASGSGALVGAVASTMIVFAVRFVHPLNMYAYAPIGLTSCVVIGWLASLMLPAAEKSLDGLTVHTMGRNRAATRSE